jgi:hypothetical protein
MAREVSSISRIGTSEPFELQVSRNQISYHTALFKYGYNPLIINVNETIWDVGGLYSYPGSALTMTVTSASGATDEDVKNYFVRFGRKLCRAKRGSDSK